MKTTIKELHSKEKHMRNAKSSISRCLAVFLCVVLLASMLPTAALASDIPLVNIDVTVPTTPQAGAPALTGASVSTGAYVYNTFWWRDDDGDGKADAYFDDTFGTEGDYYLHVTLRPESGYKVFLTATGDANIPLLYQGNLCVNGEEIPIVRADEDGTVQFDWWGKPAAPYNSIGLTYNHQGVRADVGESLTLKVKTDIPFALIYEEAKFQWYKASSSYYGTGTAIAGATGSSYTVPTNTAGQSFYYCVVTAKLKNGTTVNSENSDSQVIWVNVQNIGDGFDAYNDGETDPYIVYWSGEDFTFSPGQINDANKTVTYQWYKCDAEGFPINETLHNGRAFLIYGIPDSMLMQPIYYKCVATAHGDKTGIEKDEVLFSAVLYPKGVEEYMPFDDVPGDAYYKDAVIWAVEYGITSGTSATTFSPNGICTRAQAVTFLWRASGSPAPESTVLPFNDVPVGSYYHSAVLWAMEQGIIKGTSSTTFSPNMNCSRAQIVTMLWRMEGSELSTASNPFVDVKSGAYYTDAVLWAVYNNITAGTSATTFSPNKNCTRAQIVTFIFRDMG